MLPFTAGGFIYIATVNVIPSLLEDSNFKQSVKEIIALLVGVYLMVLVAKYEWFIFNYYNNVYNLFDCGHIQKCWIIIN